MLNGDYSFNPEYLFYRLYNLLTGTAPGAEQFVERLSNFWLWLRLISFGLTLVLVAMLVWLVLRVISLRREEHFELRQILSATQTAKPLVNEAWQRVLDYMSSLNPNDWKLAIIEADNLLDQLVKTMQLPGESLGERLKNVEPSDFATLSQAWEAHKVRNRIAHESGYTPSEVEARRAIGNYRQVFEEFQII